MNRLLLSYFHDTWINGLPSLEKWLLSSMGNIGSFFIGKWFALIMSCFYPLINRVFLL